MASGPGFTSSCLLTSSRLLIMQGSPVAAADLIAQYRSHNVHHDSIQAPSLSQGEMGTFGGFMVRGCHNAGLDQPSARGHDTHLHALGTCIRIFVEKPLFPTVKCRPQSTRPWRNLPLCHALSVTSCAKSEKVVGCASTSLDGADSTGDTSPKAL